MNYTDKLLLLRKTVPDYPSESFKWLTINVSKPSPKFQRNTITDMKVGKFYFIRYDQSSINKSSKMEQLVPMLFVDYKPDIDDKVFFILNLNFLPLNIKEAFFVNVLKNFESVLERNSSEKIKEVRQEQALNIGYEYIWKELLSYGIEYSLREIRVELIQDIYNVSTNDLQFLTTINTQKLTGLDEKKLNEIWIAKLKKESLETRISDMKIKSDYESIVKILQETFKYLDQRLKKL